MGAVHKLPSRLRMSVGVCGLELPRQATRQDGFILGGSSSVHNLSILVDHSSFGPIKLAGARSLLADRTTSYAIFVRNTSSYRTLSALSALSAPYGAKVERISFSVGPCTLLCTAIARSRARLASLRICLDTIAHQTANDDEIGRAAPQAQPQSPAQSDAAVLAPQPKQQEQPPSFASEPQPQPQLQRVAPPLAKSPLARETQQQQSKSPPQPHAQS